MRDTRRVQSKLRNTRMKEIERQALPYVEFSMAVEKGGTVWPSAGFLIEPGRKEHAGSGWVAEARR